MRRPACGMIGAALLVAVLATGTTAQSPSPVPTGPATSPTPATIPSWPDAAVPGDGGLAPGVLDWQPAPLPDLGEGRGYTDLTAWAGGFAVVERVDDEANSRSLTPAVWTSPDGMAWTRHPLPGTVRRRGVVSLLPLRKGLVIASSVQTDHDRYGFDLAFWGTTDGVRWDREGTLSWRVPRSRPGCQATHRDLVSVGDALMLYVGVCWDPCCGFAPSPGSQVWALEAKRAVRGDTIAWRSTDAATWTRTRLRGVEPVFRGDHAVGFFPWPGEVLSLWVTRFDQPARLLRSGDGVRWQPVATFPGDLELDAISTAVPTSTTVLLAGRSFAIEGDPRAYGENLLTWVTETGTMSTPTMQRQPAWAEGAIRSGATVLIMGGANGPGRNLHDTSDDEQWAWIMGSSDGGRTWDPALSWTGSAGSCVGSAVQHAAIVVMDGCQHGETPGAVTPPHPALWVATLPDAQATGVPTIADGFARTLALAGSPDPAPVEPWRSTTRWRPTRPRVA